MLDVMELTSLEGLREYRLVWHMLMRKNATPSFVLSREWLDATVRHFYPNDELKVFVVSFEDQPIGILPMRLHQEVTRFGKARVLTTVGTDRYAMAYPVGGDHAATLFGVAQYLADHRSEWDLLRFSGVDHAGIDAGRTENALRVYGLRPVRRLGSNLGLIDLKRWNEYRGIHRVGDLHRAEKQLQQQGQIEFIRHRPRPSTLREFDLRRDLLEDVLGLCHDRSQAHANFLRDVYESAAHVGMLDMNVLLVGGRPVAFAMNVHHGGVLENVAAGCLPQYQESARLSLIERILLDSRDRGETVWRFGPAQQEWAGNLINRLVPTVQWTCLAGSTPRFQVLRFGDWCKSLALMPRA